MAPKRRHRKNRRPRGKRAKAIRYRTSIYQIHVKGPDLFEGFNQILEHLYNRLMNGQPLIRENKFGTVIRSLKGAEYGSQRCIHLEVAKYNSKRTGFSWDMAKNELVTDDGRVTAQRTDLLLYPDHHVAILVHKSHGPTPSEIQAYLESVFVRGTEELKMDAVVSVVPLRVEGELKSIQKWDSLTDLSIEFYRPNPSGGPRIRRLKQLLEDSGADKGTIDLKARNASGLNRSGIRDLLSESKRLIGTGWGRVIAQGKKNGKKERIDSKELDVKKIEVKTDTDDDRSLADLFYEELSSYFD